MKRRRFETCLLKYLEENTALQSWSQTQSAIKGVHYWRPTTCCLKEYGRVSADCMSQLGPHRKTAAMPAATRRPAGAAVFAAACACRQNTIVRLHAAILALTRAKLVVVVTPAVVVGVGTIVDDPIVRMVVVPLMTSVVTMGLVVSGTEVTEAVG